LGIWVLSRNAGCHIPISAPRRLPKQLPSKFEIYAFISDGYVFEIFSPSHPKKRKLLADKSPPRRGMALNTQITIHL
jgi:hypothetical protein